MMGDISALLPSMSDIMPNIFNVLVTVIVLFIFYKIVTHALSKALEKTGYKKEKKSFLNVWRYAFVFILLIFVVNSYSGSLAALGLSVGLMGAALGWALQKPISGMAAWLMIVTKRPFVIGDRVIIGKTKGDVSDITLTHVHLKEFGGTVGGEELSGREILISNSTLFDKSIVNYTKTSRYILDEVTFTITHDSNLSKTKKMVMKHMKKITKDWADKVEERPFVRVSFAKNGIFVRARYYTIAPRRTEISSELTQYIFKDITKTKDITFAYPHRQVLGIEG